MAWPGPECPIAVLCAQLLDQTQFPEDPLAAVKVFKLVEKELDIRILWAFAKQEMQTNTKTEYNFFIRTIR